ncbi:unnamed protein product [Oncorhynchus mykiss]|uniref:Regulator of cell cycle RGCC n=1 Tax=Oncorhynchus mykiss TaxID=8022 RepID=A0A060YBG7_ONCMY|nr:unnamed protein product [Oncorhynchus mykiss]
MKSPKLKSQGKSQFLEEDDLSDVLCEFDAVIEDFTSPMEKRHFQYDEHLKTVKRRSSASVSDSGISDSESNSAIVIVSPSPLSPSVINDLSHKKARPAQGDRAKNGPNLQTSFTAKCMAIVYPHYLYSYSMYSFNLSPTSQAWEKASYEDCKHHIIIPDGSMLW